MVISPSQAPPRTIRIHVLSVFCLQGMMEDSGRVRKVAAGTHVGNGGLDQCGSIGCWKDAGVGGHCPLGFQTLVLYSVCLVF